jgi:hypothetical protein
LAKALGSKDDFEADGAGADGLAPFAALLLMKIYQLGATK